MKCVYCGNIKLYKLKSGQVKCSKCKKRFSLTSVQRDLELVDCFVKNSTANQSAKELNLNYITVNKTFSLFRKLIAYYLEEEYKNKDVIEYDEYIYLQQSKKKIKENIFDSQNFISFEYENKIYNLLMPNLNKYRNEFLDAGAEDAYFKEFSRFMMFNKISKTKKRENLISKFWLFFEDSILKYKGIRNENFIYYLKEIEFKFNYTQEKQLEILKSLLYKYLD